MDVYRDYTQNFEKYQTFTETKAFRKFLELERKSESKTQKKRVTLTPQSLLITPIQRIPRYVLLLEELLDVTLPDDPDYDNIAGSFDVSRNDRLSPLSPSLTSLPLLSLSLPSSSSHHLFLSLSPPRG